MKPVSLSAGVEAVVFTGIADPALAFFSYQLHRKYHPRTVVLVADRLRTAEIWAEDMQFFLSHLGSKAEVPVRVLPAIGDLDPEDPRSFDLECDRLGVLTALQEKDPLLIIATTPAALLERCPPPEVLAGQEIRLEAGQRFAFRELTERLGRDLGYACEAVCEAPGEYAVRGGLIDVYPLNADCPYRIDFFGDEVESIRCFDPTTQRSGSAVKQVTLAGEPPDWRGTGRPALPLDYLPDKVCWMLHEPDALIRSYPDLFQVPENLTPPLQNFQTLVNQRQGKADRWFGLTLIDMEDTLFGAVPRQTVESESLELYRPAVEASKLGVAHFESEQDVRKRFFGQLRVWQEQGHALHVVMRTEGAEARFRDILDEDPALRKLHYAPISGSLGQGFRVEWGGERLVYVTEAELFGRHRMRVGTRRRAQAERRQVDQLLDFSELVDGDYLVHLQNGVCIFRGLQKLDLGGRQEEVISLEFADGVTLHLRLHEAHLLSRYVGLKKVTPKLGKLGSNSWEKTRAAAERATLDLAAELLRLQAERESGGGYAFPEDQPWLKEFEASFPFTETPDQLQAIMDTKGDMQQARPMDRLICGDVGFGKTEVALRSAFKAVLAGKQVAVLIPTTVLCQQHFNTFRERLAEYPVVVEMLSRFRSPRQRSAINKQLKAGQIDIVVGTHSLLASSVSFRDLGLLIIDEEHRFGVKQKEKIKLLRRDVDVLSMSATPIPRTLYLALVGARDLSVIETPPRDRLPIQTVVKAYDPKLVKDAIRAEVERGGQVFYLHNRVQSIEAVAGRLQEMLPDINIGVGHGQMDEGELETVMTDFVAGRYDVLVCTTIIESGLDIPNCNTIIIEGADRFGLGQLYQLRGRVGRFNRQAYAYLLLHRHTRLLDLARKRLGAMRQYNQLGAGFRIAMRDLELRGAGNILGARQSGHIAGVGFDLYCQLLRQSVSRLKGEPQASVLRASVKLDFVIIGEWVGQEGTGETRIGYDALKEAEQAGHKVERLEASIPLSYLEEPRLRIEFYRKLAMASSLDEIDGIAADLQDRFGELPLPVRTLVEMTKIRCLAEQKGVLLVECEGNQLKCRRADPREGQFIKAGNRFPRLTQRGPTLRLREIQDFLKRQPNPSLK